MSSNNRGVSSCTIGSFIIGFGNPATADQINLGNTLIDVNGLQQDAIYLDPISQDYVFDNYGQVVGQTAISQQVYLSMATTLGSAAITTLGNTLSDINSMDPVLYQNKVRQIVYSCLEFLTINNKITINNIVFNKNANPTSINFTLLWTDNVSGQNNQTQVVI